MNHILNKFHCISFGEKTKKAGKLAITSLAPGLPWFVFIPRFVFVLIKDMMGQWTNIRIYNYDKETARISAIYGVDRI